MRRKNNVGDEVICEGSSDTNKALVKRIFFNYAKKGAQEKFAGIHMQSSCGGCNFDMICFISLEWSMFPTGLECSASQISL